MFNVSQHYFEFASNLFEFAILCCVSSFFATDLKREHDFFTYIFGQDHHFVKISFWKTYDNAVAGCWNCFRDRTTGSFFK